MSPDPAPVEKIAAEFEAVIEEALNQEPRKALHRIGIERKLLDLGGRSDAHLRCLRREQYSLAAEWPPATGGKGGKRWPFSHPLMPSPTGYGDQPDTSYLTDGEAAAYFLSRANACTDSRLRATYANFATLMASGRAKRAVAELCVSACLETFDKEVAVDSSSTRAGPVLVRAFAMATGLRATDLQTRVAARAGEFVRSNPCAILRATRDLVLGIAEHDRDRTALPYREIADAAMDCVTAKTALPEGKRPAPHALMIEFGHTYTFAGFSRDSDRRERFGRVFAEATVAMGHSCKETLHVHYWLREAASIVEKLKNAGDLLETIRKELQRLGPDLGKDLPQVTQEIQISKGTIELLDKIRAEIISAGDMWQIALATRLVEEAKEIKADEGEEEFLLSKLMEIRKTEDGRSIRYAADDPRVKPAEAIQTLLIHFFWRFVIRPGLNQIHADGRLTADHLLGPLWARAISQGDFPYVVSATSSLLEGDFVAATQGWVLVMERLVRAAVIAGGGSTTSLGQSGDEEHELSIELAIDELEKARPVETGAPIPNLCLLLRFFLGWRGPGLNLRNRVAHGTMAARENQPFTAYVAYLLALSIALVFLPVRAEAPADDDLVKPETEGPAVAE